MGTNRNINDVIVEKIHTTFIELVPEEELREIVAKAIDDFKAPRQTGDRYNREIKPSPLEEYVGKAITGLLEKAVTKHIDKALDVTLDEHGQRVASEIIQKAVNDAAPMMIENFVKNAGTMTAMMMVSSLRNELRSSGVRF